jgi:hypothetical protein
LQSLMARFGTAGWINRSFVTPPIRMDYTPLGAKRMSEMEAYFRAMEGGGVQLVPGKEAVLKIMLKEFIDELSPPVLTENEFKALGYLAEMFRLRVLEGSQED